MTTTTHIAALDLALLLSRSRRHHLSASALQTLCELATADGGLSMTALSGRLGITTCAITGIADSLTAAGLLKRRASAVDRRVYWLLLTNKGQTTLTNILCTA